MQVNPSSNSGSVDGMNEASTVRRSRAESDGASFENAEALNSALQRAPDVREGEVTRAKGLLGDVKYPPEEGIRRIANLLAIHWEAEVE
jgi:hypothetical protein